jgi:hypothetical protein
MSDLHPHVGTASAASEASRGAAALTVAVLCRADEPALGRTLATLEVAAHSLDVAGRNVRWAICVNGPAGGAALEQARAFAARVGADRVRVLVDAVADKARAWNLVRAACDTPLIAFCDADVEVAPDALAALVDTLDREPGVLLASARQVPVLSAFAGEEPDAGAGDARRATLVARAASLPYRFDFQVVGGRLYVMRAAAVERMPERLLLEDGWLSARLGNDALRTVARAEVRFHPPTTLADYLRERLRTEAGKIQIHAERRTEGTPATPIARYRWREMLSALGPSDLPLVAVNLGVRFFARGVAELAARRGRSVRWSPIASSKPQHTEVP